MPNARELGVWLVVIVASVGPTVARYPRRYWFYDEWSMSTGSRPVATAGGRSSTRSTGTR